MRKRAPERYVLVTLGFEIIFTYTCVQFVINTCVCTHVYIYLYVYINLTKMYDYMLKHHLQFSGMMRDENVNITFGTSGSNHADGSDHHDMLAHVC